MYAVGKRRRPQPQAVAENAGRRGREDRLTCEPVLAEAAYLLGEHAELPSEKLLALFERHRSEGALPGAVK
jgi:hypothetical protein